MTTWLRNFGLALVAMLALGAVAAPALADSYNGRDRYRDPGRDRDWDDEGNWDDNGDRRGRERRSRRRAAPEIDPAGAGSAIALLVGGSLLLTARRSSRRRAYSG